MDVDGLRKFKHHGHRADFALVNGLARVALRRSQLFWLGAIGLPPAAET